MCRRVLGEGGESYGSHAGEAMRISLSCSQKEFEKKVAVTLSRRTVWPDRQNHVSRRSGGSVEEANLLEPEGRGKEGQKV